MNVMIGIDPHKGSHTATMLDRADRELRQVTVHAGRNQVEQLLEWVDGVEPRTWAVECAGGMGYLLSQQLVAAGERVLDVPATLALGCGCWAPASQPRRTRTTPARWRSPRCGLRRWRWCDRPITSRCAICWPSVTLMWLAGGPSCAAGCTPSSANWCRAGSARRWSSPRHDHCSRGSGPAIVAAVERHRLAVELVTEIEQLDVVVKDSRARLSAAVTASGTTLTEIFGVGPIVAGMLIGYSGDPTRFATASATPPTRAPPRSSSPPAAGSPIGYRGAATAG